MSMAGIAVWQVIIQATADGGRKMRIMIESGAVSFAEQRFL